MSLSYILDIWEEVVQFLRHLQLRGVGATQKSRDQLGKHCSLLLVKRSRNRASSEPKTNWFAIPEGNHLTCSHRPAFHLQKSHTVIPIDSARVSATCLKSNAGSDAITHQMPSFKIVKWLIFTRLFTYP